MRDLKHNKAEKKYRPQDYLERDWDRSQKEPWIPIAEGWSNAYRDEVRDYGKKRGKK